MRIKAGIKRNNPFRNLFLSAAIISCFVLSIVFSFISSVNDKLTQAQYNQEKAELFMRDFENQLQSMKDISMKIASNYEFHPYYFEGDVSREMALLKNLEQYRYFSALSEEYFLYYGGDRIYRSTGRTLALDVFVQSQSEDEGEWERFRTELDEMRGEYPSSTIKLKTLSIFGEIYVLTSFSVNEDDGQASAVLGFAVKKGDLEERFQTISGGIRGNITLYRDSELLYCNQEEACTSEQKNVLTDGSSDGGYTLCYLPEKKNTMQSSLFLLQLLLVLADVILVFTISYFYAERAYKPIERLSEKYRGKALDKDSECENALEEVGYMMDSMLKRYALANAQIGQKQKMLRSQVLRLMLNGNVSSDVLSNLEGLQIRLPGPYFYVISISFEEEESVTEEFLNNLQKELELISDEKEKEYIYTICSLREKIIHVICSIQTEERKEELAEIVCNVAESFAYEPMIGIGNVYQALSCLSASWLESMDKIQNNKKPQRSKKQQGFIYDSKEMSRIFAVLEAGNEEEALELLDCYVVNLNKEPISMLMLQYISADFLGELTKLSKKYRLEFSRQNVSLFIAAKDVQGFKMAAKNAIHDFSEKFVSMRSEQREDELHKVYEHINAHFAEYDMSIEKVAEDLHVNIAVVRQAVLKYTGKTYKDYLIYLRIEYAKILLRQENMTVAEVCQQVGYGNISYFITLFKGMTGVTPAKYRGNIEGE